MADKLKQFQKMIYEIRSLNVMPRQRSRIYDTMQLYTVLN